MWVRHYGSKHDAKSATATAAEVAAMDDQLNEIGKLISRLKRKLVDERKAHKAVARRYAGMEYNAALARKIHRAA